MQNTTRTLTSTESDRLTRLLNRAENAADFTAEMDVREVLDAELERLMDDGVTVRELSALLHG